MNNTPNPPYEKLDLESFIFSSPTSMGWNELAFNTLLKQTVRTEKQVAEETPSQHLTFIELAIDDIDTFIECAQEAMLTNTSNPLGTTDTTLQQAWKQPLPQPKPTLNRTTFKNKPTKTANEYLLELKKRHALHNESAPPTVSTQQKTKKSTFPSKKERSRNNTKQLVMETMKTFADSGTNLQTEQSFNQLIRQLNKQTLAMLQNKRNL